MIAGALAARLVSHHRCRLTLFEWMHPQRLASVPCANRLKTCSAPQVAALAEALLNELGMPAPPLDAFNAPGAALALLPVRECLTVFRLRALAEHVEQLRSWIDRPRRSLLTEWIGPRGVRLLFERGCELTGDVRFLAMRTNEATQAGRPLSDTANGDSLAWSGFRHFERECGWAHDGPLAIAQLAMPASGDAPPPVVQSSMQRFNASLSIVSQLPTLFPEWSW